MKEVLYFAIPALIVIVVLIRIWMNRCPKCGSFKVKVERHYDYGDPMNPSFIGLSHKCKKCGHSHTSVGQQ